MFSDGIRRALGPVLRTVANTAVEKAVAPQLQPAARAVANFAVSSFERGTSPLVALNPPPPPTPQVDGKLEAGDWLTVTVNDGVNQRKDAGKTSKLLTTFPRGTMLKIAAPPENGAVVQNNFVYVESNTGQKGWVFKDYVGEISAEVAEKALADELAKARAANHQTDAADAYQDIYVNQFDAEKQVGDETGRNANCGPASTLMALRNEGLVIPSIPDITHDGSAGADVQAVRYWGNSETDPATDGVTTNEAGETVYALGWENSQYTGFEDVSNAVAAAGGSSKDVSADSASIRKAIESGMSVVVSGTFVETPAQASEGSEDAEPVLKGDTWEQGGGATDHLVAVVGMEGDDFIICDPASDCGTPIQVSAAELDAFMRGNPGAIGISGPTPGPGSEA
ncbi:C39 family peptidase [Corallococcus exiguus]|uniref:Peptidase C39-like domain-containing protein n=1 Tax=Corallococcus exiguus TaxID=83462 RepID=A0A7X5BW08_9BACT|nr:C39 family peptidase [Corallococcus exiguus]NBC42842.1 hypothetical protein [Corallococcus exiguus]TNV66535.1 hypothetical protein FH620_05690 [Corallococcus exiguus]